MLCCKVVSHLCFLVGCAAVGCAGRCKQVLAKGEGIDISCLDLDDVLEPVTLAVRKASKGLYGYGAVAGEAALLKTAACHTIK